MYLMYYLDDQGSRVYTLKVFILFFLTNTLGIFCFAMKLNYKAIATDFIKVRKRLLDLIEVLFIVISRTLYM